MCLGNLGCRCSVMIPPDHAKQKELNAESGEGLSLLRAKGMASALWAKFGYSAGVEGQVASCPCISSKH